MEELLERGLTEEDISMKGIGYKEIIAFFDGLCTREEAIDLIKRTHVTWPSARSLGLRDTKISTGSI